VLAAIGAYGVVAYLVSQVTRDIGVRMALGATPGAVVRLVVRQGLILGAIGVAIGLGVAALLTRFLRSLLFGVGPLDPLTFAAVAALLLTVAALASAAPALRAARVAPTAALNAE
jgi:ABC-type antimicrobial peptide transport system permease subunit